MSWKPVISNMYKEGYVPQLAADPVSPSPGDIWVRAATSGGGTLKSMVGLGTPLISVGTTSGYELSFRTKAGTTVRTNLT